MRRARRDGLSAVAPLTRDSPGEMAEFAGRVHLTGIAANFGASHNFTKWWPLIGCAASWQPQLHKNRWSRVA